MKFWICFHETVTDSLQLHLETRSHVVDWLSFITLHVIYVLSYAAESFQHGEYPTWNVSAADEQHCTLSRGRWLRLWVSGWKRLRQFLLLLRWLSHRGMAWEQDARAGFQDWFILTNILPHCFWPFQSGLLDRLSVSINPSVIRENG